MVHTHASEDAYQHDVLLAKTLDAERESEFLDALQHEMERIAIALSQELGRSHDVQDIQQQQYKRINAGHKNAAHTYTQLQQRLQQIQSMTNEYHLLVPVARQELRQLNSSLPKKSLPQDDHYIPGTAERCLQALEELTGDVIPPVTQSLLRQRLSVSESHSINQHHSRAEPGHMQIIASKGKLEDPGMAVCAMLDQITATHTKKMNRAVADQERIRAVPHIEALALMIDSLQQEISMLNNHIEEERSVEVKRRKKEEAIIAEEEHEMALLAEALHEVEEEALLQEEQQEAECEILRKNYRDGIAALESQFEAIMKQQDEERVELERKANDLEHEIKLAKDKFRRVCYERHPWMLQYRKLLADRGRAEEEATLEEEQKRKALPPRWIVQQTEALVKQSHSIPRIEDTWPSDKASIPPPPTTVKRAWGLQRISEAGALPYPLHYQGSVTFDNSAKFTVLLSNERGAFAQ